MPSTKTPMPSPTEKDVNGRTHNYHAHASVFSADLKLPISQKVGPQAHASLPSEGGYFAQRAEKYRLESLISFESARTHVTGNLSLKDGEGWSTLVTSVVEGLNVMEVVTCDRIVGQMITLHPLKGYVPKVNFLGTRFENLRIAGHPIEIEYDLNVLGSKPDNDEHYVLGSGVAGRLPSAVNDLKASKDIPAAMRKRYNQLSPNLGHHKDEVVCSLVKKVAGIFPGYSYGPIIVIPDFGRMTLGKVVVKHETYKKGTKTPTKTTVTFDMIDFQFGCSIDGSGTTGTGSSNGTTQP
jgi:hypothetical protein